MSRSCQGDLQITTDHMAQQNSLLHQQQQQYPMTEPHELLSQLSNTSDLSKHVDNGILLFGTSSKSYDNTDKHFTTYDSELDHHHSALNCLQNAFRKDNAVLATNDMICTNNSFLPHNAIKEDASASMRTFYENQYYKNDIDDDKSDCLSHFRRPQQPQSSDLSERRNNINSSIPLFDRCKGSDILTSCGVPSYNNDYHVNDSLHGNAANPTIYPYDTNGNCFGSCYDTNSSDYIGLYSGMTKRRVASDYMLSSSKNGMSPLSKNIATVALSSNSLMGSSNSNTTGHYDILAPSPATTTVSPLRDHENLLFTSPEIDDLPTSPLLFSPNENESNPNNIASNESNSRASCFKQRYQQQCFNYSVTDSNIGHSRTCTWDSSSNPYPSQNSLLLNEESTTLPMRLSIAFSDVLEQTPNNETWRTSGTVSSGHLMRTTEDESFINSFENDSMKFHADHKEHYSTPGLLNTLKHSSTSPLTLETPSKRGNQCNHIKSNSFEMADIASDHRSTVGSTQHGHNIDTNNLKWDKPVQLKSGTLHTVIGPYMQNKDNHKRHESVHNCDGHSNDMGQINNHNNNNVPSNHTRTKSLQDSVNLPQQSQRPTYVMSDAQLPLSVFVGNIPKNISPEVLRRTMQMKGTVTDVFCDFKASCWLTAFVTYSTFSEAAKAVEFFNNKRAFKNASHHRLVCCFAPPPPASLCVGSPHGGNSDGSSKLKEGSHTTALISEATNSTTDVPIVPFFPKYSLQLGDQSIMRKSLPVPRFSLLKDGPAGANLFIYGIPSDWTEVTLMRLTQEFGHIVGIRVPGAPASGPQRLNKGFGFVSYDSTESSARVLEALSGKQFLGKPLNIQLKLGEHLTGYPPTTPNSRNTTRNNIPDSTPNGVSPAGPRSRFNFFGNTEKQQQRKGLGNTPTFSKEKRCNTKSVERDNQNNISTTSHNINNNSPHHAHTDNVPSLHMHDSNNDENSSPPRTVIGMTKPTMSLNFSVSEKEASCSQNKNSSYNRDHVNKKQHSRNAVLLKEDDWRYTSNDASTANWGSNWWNNTNYNIVNDMESHIEPDEFCSSSPTTAGSKSTAVCHPSTNSVVTDENLGGSAVVFQQVFCPDKTTKEMITAAYEEINYNEHSDAHDKRRAKSMNILFKGGRSNSSRNSEDTLSDHHPSTNVDSMVVFEGNNYNTTNNNFNVNGNDMNVNNNASEVNRSEHHSNVSINFGLEKWDTFDSYLKDENCLDSKNLLAKSVSSPNSFASKLFGNGDGQTAQRMMTFTTTSTAPSSNNTEDYSSPSAWSGRIIQETPPPSTRKYDHQDVTLPSRTADLWSDLEWKLPLECSSGLKRPSQQQIQQQQNLIHDEIGQAAAYQFLKKQDSPPEVSPFTPLNDFKGSSSASNHLIALLRKLPDTNWNNTFNTNDDDLNRVNHDEYGEPIKHGLVFNTSTASSSSIASLFCAPIEHHLHLSQL